MPVKKELEEELVRTAGLMLAAILGPVAMQAPTVVRTAGPAGLGLMLAADPGPVRMRAPAAGRAAMLVLGQMRTQELVLGALAAGGGQRAVLAAAERVREPEVQRLLGEILSRSISMGTGSRQGELRVPIPSYSITTATE